MVLEGLHAGTIEPCVRLLTLPVRHVEAGNVKQEAVAGSEDRYCGNIDSVSLCESKIRFFFAISFWAFGVFGFVLSCA